jgi:hypothetical protein
MASAAALPQAQMLRVQLLASSAACSIVVHEGLRAMLRVCDVASQDCEVAADTIANVVALRLHITVPWPLPLRIMLFAAAPPELALQAYMLWQGSLTIFTYKQFSIPVIS